ncbi:unnamed protein product [Porites lobata]|uniref:Uncharacterized protein n=1 Tax=Porites lobata TaxID=104759 RepID=A0ABN8RH85_9CNID|nr:unnamed protein product [Porites lobata]
MAGGRQCRRHTCKRVESSKSCSMIGSKNGSYFTIWPANPGFLSLPYCGNDIKAVHSRHFNRECSPHYSNLKLSTRTTGILCCCVILSTTLGFVGFEFYSVFPGQSKYECWHFEFIDCPAHEVYLL